jgi:transcriptional regulator with XRE-family HTH domain
VPESAPKSQNVGTLLREWRTSRGWSLSRLARQAGLSKGTLSYWESGTYLPRVAELEAVLDALDVTTAERAEAWVRVGAPRAARRLREAAVAGLPGVGHLLRAMRRRRGWTQQDVASRVGVRQSAVARWERAEARPSATHLHALCVAFDARPEELAALQAGTASLESDGSAADLPDASDEGTENALSAAVDRTRR